MPGFLNLGAYAAAVEQGAHLISTFRKAPATGMSTFWADLSMSPGSPVGNYYASAPLVAATLDPERGIFHGTPVAPAKKSLRNMVLMTQSAAIATSQYYLADYLLYYPFVDMDAAGEEQLMDNTVTLPRYADGRGVKMFMVALTPSIGGGQFFVTYTNQNGVSGRQTPIHLCSNSLSIGALMATQQNIGGHMPFLSLANGDTGVRSVESVTVIAANGGLTAIVLAVPLRTLLLRDINAPREVESIRDVPVAPEIRDGAYLNLLAGTPLGALGGTIISGYAEFVWG